MNKPPQTVNVVNQPRPTPPMSIGKLDSATNSFQVVTYEHHEIHSGSSFTADYTVELGNGAVIDILVVTPDTKKWAHMVYTILCELETEMKIYEGATASNNGTGLTEFNRDRNSATAATTTVFHTPTVAGGAEGTLLRTKHFGTGRTAGAEAHDVHEFILKQNTKYLLRITNATTSNNWITAIINWYEHTNAN